MLQSWNVNNDIVVDLNTQNLSVELMFPSNYPGKRSWHFRNVVKEISTIIRLLNASLPAHMTVSFPASTAEFTVDAPDGIMWWRLRETRAKVGRWGQCEESVGRKMRRQNGIFTNLSLSDCSSPLSLNLSISAPRSRLPLSSSHIPRRHPCVVAASDNQVLRHRKGEPWGMLMLNQVKRPCA
jgi:hypothetical protein